MILIVDDCVSILRLMKWKLQAAFGKDIDVQLANDGEEAKDFYMRLLQEGTEDSLDAIVIDHHMPKCSGMDAIKFIRAQEITFEIFDPVVIIGFSADTSDEMVADMISAGANHVLPKPPEPDELESLCGEILTRRRQAGKAAKIIEKRAGGLHHLNSGDS